MSKMSSLHLRSRLSKDSGSTETNQMVVSARRFEVDQEVEEEGDLECSETKRSLQLSSSCMAGSTPKSVNEIKDLEVDEYVIAEQVLSYDLLSPVRMTVLSNAENARSTSTTSQQWLAHVVQPPGDLASF